MKKIIIQLLEELEKYTDGFVHIKLYTDMSGTVFHSMDKELFLFDSETDLIKELKDKIKELKK